MVDYREILRLSSEGYSQRQIEHCIGSSRHTITDVLATAASHGIHWPLDEHVTNEVLQATLFPDLYHTTSNYAEPDCRYIHSEMARSGVNLTLLWVEYCDRSRQAGKTPYKYTQFCDKYRKWARLTKATMRIQHKPGDVIQVDWAGNTIDVHDPVTGEVDKAYVFIAVLPCSCYAYAEACPDMQTENWLMCHVHAYEYFEGSTRLLISDNCKTGVISNTRYDTVLNRSYQELADYYGTAIIPARIRHPKDKGMAEGTVKFASTWIIASLRDRKFFSHAEVQEAVADKLEMLNTLPFKKRPGCRRTAYNEEEKEYMRPLPLVPFEPATWLRQTVGNDYLISDGRNKYSVPFDVIGKEVDIRLTQYVVEVFYGGSRIASHMREKKILRNPVIDPGHMTPEHRKYLDYNSDAFISWASGVGPGTLSVVRLFLSGGRAEEQGYKPCTSLTKLGERYGNDRIEKACTCMLELSGSPSIRTITTILKNHTDNANSRPLPGQSPKRQAENNDYAITRGADYYGKGGKGHV